MTDEEHLDAALDSVYSHNTSTGHGRSFYVSLMHLEYVCAECGEVLYEGPPFEDGIEGFKRWRAPLSH